MSKVENSIYYNFRCRKCGQIISVDSRGMGMLPTVGRLFNSKQHKNCTDINEGEMVCCDAISQSDYALPNAVDVLFWNSETGKYDE